MNNGDRIVEKLDNHDEVLTHHSETLADHSEQLVFIRENMVMRSEFTELREELKQFATKQDLKEELKKYATKEDLHGLEDRLMTALDRQMVILQRLDQERIFTNLHLQRHDNEIAQIRGH